LVQMPGLLDGSGPFSVELSIDQNGAWIQWMESTTLGTLAVTDSVTDTLTINDIAKITNSIRLNNGYDPAIITLIYQAVRNGCRGNLDSVSFTVSPIAGQFFIPEVMTPNNDGANDKWEIRFDAALTASDYYIDVYNRAGGRVKTLSSLDETWMGDNHPDGVYWWMLYRKGGGVLKSGGLTIRRK
jgi:gliding motility-associated-like protein